MNRWNTNYHTKYDLIKFTMAPGGYVGKFNDTVFSARDYVEIGVKSVEEELGW